MKMRCLAMMALVLATASALPADDSATGCRCRLCAPLCPCLGGTPDDYCPKPWPTLIPVDCCGGPCDYCRKPPPHIIPVEHCGHPCDYERKPPPHLLCPPASPYLLYYTSPEPCCAPRKHH